MPRPLSLSLRATWVALRELLLSAGPLVLLTALLLVLAYRWLQPAPPRAVVLATGPEQSAYDAFGQRYARALAADGIHVTLRPTEGAAENLALLRRGEVDLGFVQGGSVTLEPQDQEGLRSLGSLFVEPLWVFYREEAARRRLRRPALHSLTELEGWRVNVGTPGSGVPRLFGALLEANRLSPQRLRLSELPQTPATVAFLAGELDALVFASAPEAPMVQMLLLTPGVRLLDFAQSEAYARRFGFLTPVVLPQGLVDLAGNRPDRDLRLVASTTSLLAGADTHPALLQRFAQTAVALHGGAGWFSRAREHPSLEHSEVPLSDEAVRAIRHGPPLLQRYLPFWLANLIERMGLALGLILALVLPLSRIVPPLYTFRIRSRVFRWYAELRELELRFENLPATQENNEPAHAETRAALRDELDTLEERVRQVVVPLAYAEELYTLRQHIRLVRQKLTLPL